MDRVPLRAAAALLLLLALAPALAACGNSRRGGPATGPVAITSDALSKGRHVFMRNCYQCHPGGQAGLGPAINNKPLAGFMIHTQVRQGVGAMPGFSEKEISDEDLEHLIDYIQELRRKKQ